MRYMLLIYANEAAMATAPSEKTYEISAAYGAYTEALKKSGAWLAGDRLRPTQSATAVRTSDGKTNVLDGPYADTKEQLAGFYMIEAEDADAAIAWAARCPGASAGTIEVRPIWEMSDYPSAN
ncbi:YciI family protein [Mesorhizobium sp. M4A.F.Ca.ET.022.05.2.1]|uniref:YciI family protein n=1 Tax=unclassified Mesorhizobium TaxID=325217 RepID=UPI000FCA772C|nr:MULTISPECIES: YciI family protein [unclassified Mesorhizobium]RVC78689.1 YciI family protein [Mesorhizobium sp. M4A.F.Ca.ET.022.05.2.1]RVD74063.1 YciI family protein [Mesorhizobium sp. M4A.F.Ca.ET.029.04.2.1]TIW30388.1 MAG: YciI family protein [Mesorhizobium sp.]